MTRKSDLVKRILTELKKNKKKKKSCMPERNTNRNFHAEIRYDESLLRDGREKTYSMT